MKVFKFGGSSVKDAAAMKRVANILKESNDCSLVIISATKNTTNELEEVGLASAKSKDTGLKLWRDTFSRHTLIIEELGTTTSLEDLSKEVESIIEKIQLNQELNPELMDSLYSIGERLSTAILSDYLVNILNRKVIYKDAREVLTTDENFSRATPLLNEMKSRVWNISENELIISQGFIARSLDGRTTTLGREGSDYSATLFGELYECDEVVIWTDVCGVATIDPRLSKQAKYISHMSYDQASSLAHYGAKVLFDRTLAPAQRNNFIVRVKSTMNPDAIGTIISNDENSAKLLAMAVADDIVTIIGAHVDSQKVMKSLCLDKIVNQSRTSISFKIPSSQMDSVIADAHKMILEYHQSE